MEVYYQDQLVGYAQTSSIPALYFACRELGYQIDIRHSEQKMFLRPGLTTSSLTLVSGQDDHEFMWVTEKVVEETGESLRETGVNVFVTQERPSVSDSDAIIDLTMGYEQNYKQMALEVTRGSQVEQVEEWLEFLQVECIREGVKLMLTNTAHAVTDKYLRFHFTFPTLEEEYLQEATARITHLLSITLICYLQKLYGVSPFSILSKEVAPLGLDLSTLFDIDRVDPPAFDPVKIENTDESPVVEKVLTVKPYPEALAYFDYHILIRQHSQKTPKIFGNFTIKNTGTMPLKDPHICFRMSPIGSVEVTGQILPPRTLQTLGLQTINGTRGWMYSKDNWLEEAGEKGEIWIQPIQELFLVPGEEVTISSLQIQLTADEDWTEVKLEGFVYFPKEEYRTVASNKISLLLPKLGIEG